MTNVDKDVEKINGTLAHCWCECKMVQITVCHVPQSLYKLSCLIRESCEIGIVIT